MDTVIFICGCGHSGTTLMANMLAAHPDVYVPLRETEIFRTRSVEEAAEGYRALHAEAEESGKRVLAEKTPGHIRHMGLIRRIVPDPLFIVPVRDGRDVAASFARRTGDAGRGVKQWIKRNSMALAARDRSDVLVYRHEDLITDTEGTLRKVSEFAAIPFDEVMLRYHEQERLWFGQEAVKPASGVGKTHIQRRNWQVNQPIFDNRGQWRSTLTPDDFPELLEGHGRELMESFGYLDRSEV
jgi:Sulfotransferase family